MTSRSGRKTAYWYATMSLDTVGPCRRIASHDNGFNRQREASLQRTSTSKPNCSTSTASSGKRTQHARNDSQTDAVLGGKRWQ